MKGINWRIIKATHHVVSHPSTTHIVHFILPTTLPCRVSSLPFYPSPWELRNLGFPRSKKPRSFSWLRCRTGHQTEVRGPETSPTIFHVSLLPCAGPQCPPPPHCLPTEPGCDFTTGPWHHLGSGGLAVKWRHEIQNTKTETLCRVLKPSHEGLGTGTNIAILEVSEWEFSHYLRVYPEAREESWESRRGVLDVNAESSPGSLLRCTFWVLLQRLGLLGCEAKPRNCSFNKHQGLWARTEFRNTSEKPGRIPSVIETGERCTCSNTGGTRREEREHVQSHC